MLMRTFFSFREHIKKNWATILSSLVVGVLFGFFLFTPKIKNLTQLEGKPLRIPDINYPLINTLIGYDNAEATNFGQLINFKAKIHDLIKKEIAQNNASTISIYFRDLNAGRWISINGNESYMPASLLKVPLMITYYHLSETNPLLLTKQIKYDGNGNFDDRQNIQPDKKLKAGENYTVEQLINEMIIYSDNDSAELLLNNIGSEELNKMFKDMDIFLPGNLGAQDFLSVKNYALFLRILYGATYLNRTNSEKALELLSKSVFKDGLVSGVPDKTVVAHKFGEYKLLDPTNKNTIKSEFHDCGIIYYPQEPYLLCVMTKGDDLSKLEKSVSDISGLVYSEVDNQTN